MKRVISCVLLMLVLTSNAFALEVPTDTVVQNLNGSQQAIKTFTLRKRPIRRLQAMLQQRNMLAM